MMEVTAAADQRRRRRGMVRATEAALTIAFGAELTDQRQDGGRGPRFGIAQRRQQAGQAGGEHRLAGAGRADHQ